MLTFQKLEWLDIVISIYDDYGAYADRWPHDPCICSNGDGLTIGGRDGDWKYVFDIDRLKALLSNEIKTDIEADAQGFFTGVLEMSADRISKILCVEKVVVQ